MKREEPMAVTPPPIQLDQAGISFGEQVGVADMSLTVAPGTIFGLIGPSGSGKTTAVRLLTGIYQPDTGSVYVLGEKPGHDNRRLHEQIGYVPQFFTLYPNLTVWENLQFVASLYGLSYFGRRRHLLDLLSFVELEPARSRLGGKLSGGMQRRLSLACALVHSPSLIFADEPTAGIDPVLRGKFWEHFRQLRDEGRTIFVTTQYVGEVTHCDAVGVMRDGRLLFVDSPDGLRRKALGGEIIRLVVAPAQLGAARATLLSHPATSDVRRAPDQPGALYVVVERAGEALPALLTALGERPDVDVQVAEEYQPPFDDILVALLEQTEDRHGR
jgi:ABC-2 type transport system ATP-binding protein